MTSSFPVPLDNLIAYVRAQQPQGNPLDLLAAAVATAERLDEQSDALIGHFVDQARRSGASWSQIGQSMGVSKQAAQKRFVPKWNAAQDWPEGQLFSRFTARARKVLAAAKGICGTEPVSAAAIVVGQFTEPEGLAARILASSTDQPTLEKAFGVALPEARPNAGLDSDAAALREISFAEDAQESLRGTLKAVLRLGHNYVGTEHLLLGTLFAGGPAAETLAGLGVTVELVEAGIATELARIQAERAR